MQPILTLNFRHLGHLDYDQRDGLCVRSVVSSAHTFAHATPMVTRILLAISHQEVCVQDLLGKKAGNIATAG